MNSVHIGELRNHKDEISHIYFWHVGIDHPRMYNLRLTPVGRDQPSAYYHVSEFPNDFGARSFHFLPLEGNTDREAESYDVCCGNPQDRSCECRGFLRHGRCKHTAFILELLEKEQEWDAEEMAIAHQDEQEAPRPAPVAPIRPAGYFGTAELEVI